MDLFDFFFPEQAQASHLRRIANQRRTTRQVSGDASAEIGALQEDVKFLTLVLAAILRRLTETQTLSLADVKDLLAEIDGLDGMADGGLDPGVLRGLVGVLQQNEETVAENDEFKIVTTPRYRDR